jgi:hypothetical protein
MVLATFGFCFLQIPVNKQTEIEADFGGVKLGESNKLTESGHQPTFLNIIQSTIALIFTRNMMFLNL